jgi:hypothetical protein
MLGMMACQRGAQGLAGSRHASFHGSTLITEYRNDHRRNTKIALAHVLFVPDRDVPRDGGFGSGTGSGGTVDKHELSFQYYDTDSGVSVRARPVTITRSKSMEAGGRTFELARGNVFVALVHSDGSVVLSQMRQVIEEADASEESILAVMKAALPNDARLQAVSR